MRFLANENFPGTAVMRFVMLTLGVLAGGCSVALAEGTPTAPPLASYSLSDRPSQDGRCRGDTGIGDLDRSEKACLDQLAQVAERHGNTLHLRFRNGSTKVYRDKSAGCNGGKFEDCVDFKLTGYFPAHGLLLIQIGYYEGVEWLLVRIQTGQESKVLAPPHYSPHQKWLASVSASEGPSGGGNGIDIVPTTLNQTAREWHYRLPNDDYALYAFVAWDGDERVTLTVTSRDGTTLPASADRVNETWQLKRSNETP